MRSHRASSTSGRIDEEVHIDALSHDGRGLARYRGKALFVEGALQGEDVKVQVTEEKRRFISARTREVVKPSAERCLPPCRHFKQCGGCSLQYWSHQGQIKGKQQIVLDQLRRFADQVPLEVNEPLLSEPYGYRYRCRLSIRWKKGHLHIGFREKSSQAICSITECPVLVEPLQALPQQLRTHLPELKAREAITHTECFLADNGVGVLLRNIRSLPDEDHRRLIRFAEDHKLQLYLQDNNGQVKCLHAPSGQNWPTYQLPKYQVELEFQPQDFTQVNWFVNRDMITRAIEWLQPKITDNVLDLFCGLGNFSLPLARKAAFVTGVEGSESSVERAKDNAKRNSLDNTAFYAADLSADLASQPWTQKQYDIVLLDPPRTGAQEVIKQMSNLLPPKVLYISCNPATLARDTGILAEQGFIIQRLSVMDMFPQTAHVESMALFVRTKK
ncbi:hypothetical protein ACH42_14865 [Endozoicomonas sp. (ex Bugula neritina AB1)]|nr:hypothetical protein ACH42_14865 [Endozoicomonas sp. (ex Bugula neritina AB1)]